MNELIEAGRRHGDDRRHTRRLVAQEDEPLTDLLDRLDVADLRALTVGIEALTRVAEAAGTTSQD